jgi:arginyl-tRNA--protein-N-Asp/Glu arginylyltransferase
MRVVQDRYESCIYKPGEIQRCPARVPTARLTPEQLDLMLEEGDQRVGRSLFRTECPFCNACAPVRVDVAAFRPSRDQRRNLRRNDAELRIEVGEPELSRRRVALWNRHRRERGLLTEHSRRDPPGYEDWLVHTCAPTVEVRYLLGDQLVGVSLLDVGRNSANSAYHYFDPRESRRGIGTYSVLKELELCRALGLRWYYLGLWVEACGPLRYKTGFHPHERLTRGRWVREDEAVTPVAAEAPSHETLTDDILLAVLRETMTLSRSPREDRG